MLVTDHVAGRADVFAALSGEQAVHNLDALADRLRELGVECVTFTDWHMPAADDAALREVFADVGVRLCA